SSAASDVYKRQCKHRQNACKTNVIVNPALRMASGMEPLSVMGLVEPLKNLPTLLRIRRGLREHFTARPPAAFIGIDAPDFNLGLELKLRKEGIKTVHYVSPSVWAWRQKRITKIARAVDHMLTLLPFEAEFYKSHDVPVTFVGHPLADELPLLPDRDKARAELGLGDQDKPLVALLPGSRKGEIIHLGRLFLETARRCQQVIPELSFILPAANLARRHQLDILMADFKDVSVTVIDGQSHAAMAAADAVLLASGTTALEAMLLKKPMVVSYKTGWVSHAIISRMLKVPYVSLPNLLAGEKLVPELLQSEATVKNLAEGLLVMLQQPQRHESITERFTELHKSLRRDASSVAADTVLDLIGFSPVEAGARESHRVESSSDQHGSGEIETKSGD
ncbi:MAG: lipid-A-disaccharide synthase, partial [Porticoccaceae bacterium]|nr:lipid-A-disaccharide synthase [Porticoccaceae bacterium]